MFGAVVVALIAGGLWVWKPWQPPALAEIGDDSVGVIDTGRGEIIDSIKVGGRPGAIAVSDGTVWVANAGSDTVSEIDLASRKVTREIDVGRSPTGITVAQGSVWVANSGARSVTQINVATSRVVQEIEVGNAPIAIAAGGGSIWVANSSDSAVVPIDATTGVAGTAVPVAAGPVALAVADGAVWVASADSAEVTRLDAATGVTLASPITLSSRPTALAVAAGTVWVTSADGTLTRIDPASNRVTATIDVGGSLSAVVGDSNTIWVADRQGFVNRLAAADPSAARTRIGTTSSPEGLALVGGAIWVLAHSSPSAHRGGTLRAVDTVMPANEGLINQFEADGLVGFRRVGGAAGNALLPDLATAVPKPTNGGKTYTFQLRAGLVYASGASVAPADFRRALERSFQVANSFTGQAMGNYYFTKVTGAEACANADFKPVPRCDLSSGVLTDDATNTITFLLSEPDPAFLYGLTSPTAYPVPDGTPMGAEVDGAFPGTGPYVVAAHNPSEYRLERNPNFHVWDADVRPDGFPDEIVISVVGSAEEAVATVERGEADFTSLRLLNTVSADSFARLRRQSPGQLHFASNTVTSISLNTALPPFDNIAARQAANMAVDRGHLVDLHGGVLESAVTCQVLPPGTSGYRPYCPYTTHPDPGGRWQAPDLSAARRLMDESGTAGTKVVVGPVLAQFAAQRDYVVTLLQELGYDASADPVTDEEHVFSTAFAGDGAQVQVWEWFGGFAAGDFLRAFRCGENSGTTNLCDPAFDALIASAGELQVSDQAAAAAKWAEADRIIVDLAVWVPLYNEGSDFVSARVGNYQFHPFYQALIDQMWVQ